MSEFRAFFGRQSRFPHLFFLKNETSSSLNCTVYLNLFSFSVYRILPYAQEVVKSNECQITYCLCLYQTLLSIAHFDHQFQDIGFHWEHPFSGWIRLGVPAYNYLYCQEEFFRPYYLCGVVVAGQSNPLANGCDCASNCATLDLSSSTIVSCLCPSGKACEA